MRHLPFRRLTHAIVALAVLYTAAASVAFAQVTTPKQFFGHNIGDDYWLPTYTQFTAYWQKIAKESLRARLDTIGKTAEGRAALNDCLEPREHPEPREVP